MGKKALILIQIASLILISCGGDKGSNLNKSLSENDYSLPIYWGSCNYQEELNSKSNFKHKEIKTIKNNCIEWYGDYFSTFNMDLACDTYSHSTMSTDYCSSEKVLGICIIPIGIESETKIFYYQNDWDEISAEKSCMNEGADAQWHIL